MSQISFPNDETRIIFDFLSQHNKLKQSKEHVDGFLSVIHLGTSDEFVRSCIRHVVGCADIDFCLDLKENDDA